MTNYSKYLSFDFLQLLIGAAILMIFISFLSKYITEHISSKKYYGRYYLHSFIVYSSSMILGVIYQLTFYEQRFFGGISASMFFVALLSFFSFALLSYFVKYRMANNSFAFVLGDLILMLILIGIWGLFIYAFLNAPLNGLG
jgi:hypothetical protein